MKYISPGGWFSLEYPMGWHEFEDTEESFLFYPTLFIVDSFQVIKTDMGTI